MTDHIVVLMTCKNAREGGRIARHLLDKNLIACANLVPQIQSIYRWKKKIVSEKECWVILKSTRELFPALRIEVEKQHSYTLPELIALPIIDGSPNYLNWVTGELASANKK
jgi:periplasmic divalent cation tolerance protein